MVGARQQRAWRWGLAITALLVAGGLAALVVPSINRRSITPVSRGVEFGDSADAAAGMDDPTGAVGTKGGGDLGGGPGQSPPATPLMELSTLTEDKDLGHLVGRRISFHVQAGDLASDVAFWVGAEGKRLLVVADRDTRDGLDRQLGRPPRHDVLRIRRGEGATVTGVVERVPYAEATYSWNLSREDVEELSKRDVYVRAVSLTPWSGAHPPATRP